MESNYSILLDFLNKNGYNNKNYKMFTLIDVHTGLGPKGVDTLGVPNFE